MDEKDTSKKHCTGPCDRTLDATTEFFYAAKRGKYGLSSRCKKCKDEYAKARMSHPEVREKTRAHQREYDKKRYHNNAHEKKRRSDYDKRPEVRERKRAYRASPEVKERTRVYTRAYYMRPEVRAHQRAWQQEYHSRPSSQEHYRAYRKERNSRPEVKELNRVYRRLKRARKRSVEGTYTPEQIQEQLKRQKCKCYYCQKRFQKVKGRYVYHIEHTFPISRVAGTDIPANSIDYIVLACPTCNISKGDKFPWEYPDGGRLL